MKQFIYRPESVGLSEWPSGTLRLEGIEVTTDPEEATVFVVPGNLSMFKDDLGVLDRLPFIAGREDRLAAFDVSDNFTQALCRKWMIIRCDARDWMLKDDPNTLPFAWPVESYDECIDVPAGGFTYDVSGHMWSSSQARADSAQACLNNAELKCDIALYSDFTGYLHDRATGQWNAEGIRRRAEFRRSMKESRIALCPESIPGVFPYRFFEACSAGRVPLLVGSGFCFPFEAEIPYSEFIITCERDDAGRADMVAREFIRNHTDSQIIEMGLKARKYWEQWLDCRNWGKLHSYAVKQKMFALGLTTEEAVL